MKHILTFILCLAVTGLLFAGNTATVMQVGDGSTATEMEGVI